MHVIIDGYGGDSDQLADENVVRVMLDELPGLMGMTKITQPNVLRYTGSKPEDWGVSGVVMIAESHIAVHTFPARRLVWADVFSCKDFDESIVIEEFKRRFSLGQMEIHNLRRELAPFEAEPEKAVAAV